MKDLLHTMFTGWIEAERLVSLQETNDPTVDWQRKGMLVACDGDENKAFLLSIFSEWRNDIVDVAAHYGIGLARKQPDGTLKYPGGTIGELVIIEVPEAPSPDHYWFGGEWRFDGFDDAD